VLVVLDCVLLLVASAVPVFLLVVVLLVAEVVPSSSSEVVVPCPSSFLPLVGWALAELLLVADDDVFGASLAEGPAAALVPKAGCGVDAGVA
jgi:hypothetical protein